jgi:glycosyltransferase EpsE
MATFNEPSEIISLAIKSILEQTLTDIELIIVDDSTEPDTIKTINDLSADPRVIILRHNERIGFVRALNCGLKIARGKYIARMDGDDIAESYRLDLQIRFLERNSLYSVVGGAMNLINEAGSITSSRYYPSTSLKLKWWSVFRCPVAHPTVMMRREIIDKGFFYDESFIKAEDLEFWLRLMKNGYKFYNLRTILVNFRVSGNFLSKRSGNQLMHNLRARYKNFYWKNPLVSSFSILVSFIYTIIPKFFITKMYSSEIHGSTK